MLLVVEGFFGIFSARVYRMDEGLIPSFFDVARVLM